MSWLRLDRPVEALREAESAPMSGVHVGVRVARVLRSHLDQGAGVGDDSIPWKGRWT